MYGKKLSYFNQQLILPELQVCQSSWQGIGFSTLILALDLAHKQSPFLALFEDSCCVP